MVKDLWDKAQQAVQEKDSKLHNSENNLQHAAMTMPDFKEWGHS